MLYGQQIVRDVLEGYISENDMWIFMIVSQQDLS